MGTAVKLKIVFIKLPVDKSNLAANDRQGPGHGYLIVGKGNIQLIS
jgi:hypothetical protein